MNERAQINIVMPMYANDFSIGQVMSDDVNDRIEVFAGKNNVKVATIYPDGKVETHNQDREPAAPPATVLYNRGDRVEFEYAGGKMLGRIIEREVRGRGWWVRGDDGRTFDFTAEELTRVEETQEPTAFTPAKSYTYADMRKALLGWLDHLEAGGGVGTVDRYLAKLFPQRENTEEPASPPAPSSKDGPMDLASALQQICILADYVLEDVRSLKVRLPTDVAKLARLAHWACDEASYLNVKQISDELASRSLPTAPLPAEVHVLSYFDTGSLRTQIDSVHATPTSLRLRATELGSPTWHINRLPVQGAKAKPELDIDAILEHMRDVLERGR